LPLGIFCPFCWTWWQVWLKNNKIGTIK